jgi:hypothetical protein
MIDWYYAPWQYELREWLPEYGPRTGSALTRVGVPSPVVAGVGAAVVALAYLPLSQPGPPARRGDPFTLAPISLGGGLIV